MDTIAAVESIARKLPPLDASDLHRQICGFLKCAKIPKSNLSRNQRIALKDLRGLKEEVILPADRGNATVIMTKCDYEEKMKQLLEANTYRKLSCLKQTLTES